MCVFFTLTKGHTFNIDITEDFPNHVMGLMRLKEPRLLPNTLSKVTIPTCFVVFLPLSLNFASINSDVLRSRKSNNDLHDMVESLTDFSFPTTGR